MVFLSGLIDSVAGGGGLISLPAYLLAGLPPHAALGTSKLSSVLGTAAAVWRLRRAGALNLRLTLWPVVAAFLGSWAGASAALAVPAEVFRLVLLVLLPLTALIVLRSHAFRDESTTIPDDRRIGLMSIVSAGCSLWDGFYGPGAGTFLLIGFAGAAQMGVREASAQSKAVNLTSGAAALIAFCTAGAVDVALGLTAAAFGMLGNWVGSGFVIRNGIRAVRPVIALVLVMLFAKTVFERIG